MSIAIETFRGSGIVNTQRRTGRSILAGTKEAQIGGPGVTPEEAAEIDQLRAARGRGPRGEDQRP